MAIKEADARLVTMNVVNKEQHNGNKKFEEERKQEYEIKERFKVNVKRFSRR